MLLPTSHLAPVRTQSKKKKSFFQISLTFFPLSQEGWVLRNMSKAENYEKHSQNRMPWCVCDLFWGAQMFMTPFWVSLELLHSFSSFFFFFLRRCSKSVLGSTLTQTRTKGWLQTDEGIHERMNEFLYFCTDNDRSAIVK